MRIKDGDYLDYSDVLILPHRSTLKSRNEVNLERTFKLKNSGKTWSGVPIFISNLDTTGTIGMFNVAKEYKLPTLLHKFYEADKLIEFYNSLSDEETQYAWYCLGMRDDDLEKYNYVKSKVGNKIQYVGIDVPSAYIESYVEFLQKFRDNNKDVGLMAGSVATGEMAEELILSGADVVRAGIGSGGLCLTRRVARIGVPMLSCVIECADHAHGLNGLLCADGGVVHPGDLSVAFGANADFVMMGTVFVGHDECEGEFIDEEKEFPAVDSNGNFTGNMVKIKTGKRLFKAYGMSSHAAQMKHYGEIKKYRASEGRETYVPYKGSVRNTIQEYLGGVSSTCTYVGARNLKELAKRTTFIKVKTQLNTVLEK